MYKRCKQERLASLEAAEKELNGIFAGAYKVCCTAIDNAANKLTRELQYHREYKEDTGKQAYKQNVETAVADFRNTLDNALTHFETAIGAANCGNKLAHTYWESVRVAMCTKVYTIVAETDIAPEMMPRATDKSGWPKLIKQAFANIK